MENTKPPFQNLTQKDPPEKAQGNLGGLSLAAAAALKKSAIGPLAREPATSMPSAVALAQAQREAEAEKPADRGSQPTGLPKDFSAPAGLPKPQPGQIMPSLLAEEHFTELFRLWLAEIGAELPPASEKSAMTHLDEHAPRLAAALLERLRKEVL